MQMLMLMLRAPCLGHLALEILPSCQRECVVISLISSYLLVRETTEYAPPYLCIELPVGKMLARNPSKDCLALSLLALRYARYLDLMVICDYEVRTSYADCQQVFYAVPAKVC